MEFFWGLWLCIILFSMWIMQRIPVWEKLEEDCQISDRFRYLFLSTVQLHNAYTLSKKKKIRNVLKKKLKAILAITNKYLSPLCFNQKHQVKKYFQTYLSIGWPRILPPKVSYLTKLSIIFSQHETINKWRRHKDEEHYFS